ncbi:aldehyde dehydrogenase family protein [Flavobacteriaceae bacterium AU392]|nr:aldehyde dehydrogenase [Flavobacteriaceae bacterium]RKM85403.1 aldehyde dehydrogenase family protein [Flavobacteriaceae bacterium AU392]
MDASNLIASQQVFFKSHQTKNVDYRKTALKKLKAEILLREQDIYNAIQDDFNKPEFETYISEIGVVLSEIDLAIKNINRWAKPKRVRASLLNFPSHDYIYNDPYGTVLIISPWNYPFQLAIAPLIVAIAAGNTVVLKPSEHTPNTSRLIFKIITTVFESKYVSVILGDASVAEKLLVHRWDYIFFTGSVSVGKFIAKAAAEHLTPVTLELGGKSPCIVDDTINLKLTARRIVWGKLLNAGQTCIAPDYLLVKSNIKEQLTIAIINEIKAAYSLDIEQSKDYSRIVNHNHLQRLKNLLEDETLLYGGETNIETNYLAPTLVDNPSLESAIMKEEIFGPILPIITFDTETDIDNVISHFEKPLSFYVFSKDKIFINTILSRYSFGGGVINDTLVHFANHKLPFGGVGHSGYGAYHGKTGFTTFSHQKAIVKKGTWLDISLRYAPYKGKLKLLKRLFKYLS